MIFHPLGLERSSHFDILLIMRAMIDRRKYECSKNHEGFFDD